jgi:transcription antitermination factor NusG
MSGTEDRSSPWYALHVKPRHEKRTVQALESKGVEHFLPLYRTRRRWSDRYKCVELPLFPGYVFSRIEPRFRVPILAIPGVLYIVGAGGVFLPVEDAEIAALQSIVRSGLPSHPWPFLRSGQGIRIDGGPLCGLTGILLECKGAHRLVVSVSLLQRSVAVEIESDWVTPLPLPAPRPVASALHSLSGQPRVQELPERSRLAVCTR